MTNQLTARASCLKLTRGDQRRCLSRWSCQLYIFPPTSKWKANKSGVVFLWTGAVPLTSVSYSWTTSPSPVVIVWGGNGCQAKPLLLQLVKRMLFMRGCTLNLKTLPQNCTLRAISGSVLLPKPQYLFPSLCLPPTSLLIKNLFHWGINVRQLLWRRPLVFTVFQSTFKTVHRQSPPGWFPSTGCESFLSPLHDTAAAPPTRPAVWKTSQQIDSCEHFRTTKGKTQQISLN